MCVIGRMRLKVKNCYVSPSQFIQWNHSKEVQCFYIQYTVNIYLYILLYQCRSDCYRLKCLNN